MYSACVFGRRMDDEFGFYYTGAEDISPELQTNFVSIQGMNGTLDLSKQDGLAFYNSVDKEWRFEKVTRNTSVSDIQLEARRLRNAFLGMNGKVVFDYDKEYYYDVTVTKIDVTCEDGGRLVALLTVHCQPFRYMVNETIVSGEVSTFREFSLINMKVPVSPYIEVDSDMMLQYEINGTQYQATISPATHYIDTLVLFEGVTEIAVSGSGNISFKYRQGSF